MKGKISLLAGDLRVNNIVRLNNLEYHPEFSGRLCIVQGVQANNANGCVVWLKVAGDLPIHEKIVSNICQLIEYVVPVELSPEILVKAGFKKECDGSVWAIGLPLGNGSDLILEDATADFILPFDIVIRREKDRPTDINHPYMYLNSVRYLHQLQNLYYILCGAELKINL